ncbi:cyclic diguanylate phosphodiesterase domain protein [Burkholderia mallei PRL-20]|nr:cyclic diguanylate phosphodiesterase domain protein [Burkholderia mallei PRL-20]
MRYHDVTLASAFQPVISITHKRVVGYEALARATDANGAPISPDTLFARAQARGETILLDRLTRCLHVANFAAQDTGACWLFLNVLPQMFDAGIAPGAFIEALCAHFALPPTRVVLEVIEQPSRNEVALARTIDMIQHGDFLIAVDDFGTGFSNFDRIWQIKPDIVKLDRSILERSLAASDAHRIIHHLVTMLHHAGTMVLAEGVENEDALQILMDADVDFVQGFCFGRPAPSLEHARRAGAHRGRVAALRRAHEGTVRRRRASRLRHDRADHAHGRRRLCADPKPARRRAAAADEPDRAARVRGGSERRASGAIGHDRDAGRAERDGAAARAAAARAALQLVAARVLPARDRGARTRRADGPALFADGRPRLLHGRRRDPPRDDAEGVLRRLRLFVVRGRTLARRQARRKPRALAGAPTSGCAAGVPSSWPDGDMRRDAGRFFASARLNLRACTLLRFYASTSLRLYVSTSLRLCAFELLSF